MTTAPRVRDRDGGIFRRNRTLFIILLDLIVILILGVFLVRFLYTQVNRANLEGYSVVLRGKRTAEVVLATLSITGTAAASTAEQRVVVRFSLERNPPEEDSIYVSGMAGEGERILRAAIPLSASTTSSEVLYAEVQIGSTRRRLSTGLEP
jgi:hypothetical protein